MKIRRKGRTIKWQRIKRRERKKSRRSNKRIRIRGRG
jgi:hypothetical protein